MHGWFQHVRMFTASAQAPGKSRVVHLLRFTPIAPRFRSTCNLGILVAWVCLANPSADGQVRDQGEPWAPIARLEIILPADLLPEATSGEQLAQAIRLIGAQPRTNANLEAATQLLKKLSANPADSEVAAAAGYHLARMLQWARPEPRPLEAAQQYLALNERYPLTFHGQLALLRAIPILCYLNPSPAQFDQELARLTTRARAIARVELKRTALAALAEAAHRRGSSPAEAAALSAEAAALPFDHRAIRSGVLLGAANRAYLAGKTTEAAEQLRRFLREFPDDTRAYEARVLLKQWTEAYP